MFYINHQVFILTTIISKKHYLSQDITFNILFYYTFPFVQKIIKAWRDYIAIHRTNLNYLLFKLPIKLGIINNIHYYYYDLNDNNTCITAKILYKYITPLTLSSFSIDYFISLFKNGIFFSYINFNPDILNLTCNHIYFLIDKINNFTYILSQSNNHIHYSIN